MGTAGNTHRQGLRAAVESYSRNPGLSTIELRKVRIAIASDSLPQRTYLKKAMADWGLNVVLNEPLTPAFVDNLHKSEAEVLILDLHDDIEHDEELFEYLLVESGVPIVFNDVVALTINEPRVLARWHGTLLRKIVELASRQNDIDVDAVMESGMRTVESGFLKASEDRVFPGQKPAGELAMNVWVLGASLGGPEAVKRFLREIPLDLPVAFILAQHLGANFVHLLAEQLDRETNFRVVRPQVGHVLRHGQVLIAPIDDKLVINSVGTAELHPAPRVSRYLPSIDMVISDFANRYPARSGTIIFSGMGDDGQLGIKTMAEKGGQVWAQQADSCVISSMPDKARETGLVGFSGSPEALVKQLVKHFRQLN